VAVDKEGCVYVVDSGNNRVFKFRPTEEEIKRTEQAKKPQEAGALAAPRSVVAKAGDTEVTLSWLDVPGAIAYNLYFHTAPELTVETGTRIEGVTSPFTHTGLTNGTTYYYLLTAVYGDEAESRPSE